MPKGRKITDEQICLVRENFANMTKGELALLAGVSRTTVDRIQSMFKLKKSAQHLHNMGVKAGKASNIARGGRFIGNHTPEANAKRLASYRETYRLDDMRVRWGLPQRTKIRLKHGSVQQQDQASYLRGLGYIIDDKERVAYYTETTKRATRLEGLTRGEKKGPMCCYYQFKAYQNDNR